MAPMPCIEFSSEQQLTMRSVARQAIDSGLEDEVFRPDLRGVDVALTGDGASFVTITKDSALRGCIGTLQAFQPLLVDVAVNAHKAAFSDPRFAPLSQQEWVKCELSISVLSQPQSLLVSSEQDICNKLRPAVDGLILSFGSHRATFLPAVWEQLSDPLTFVRELKSKAGLSKDFWSSDISLEIYQSTSF